MIEKVSIVGMGSLGLLFGSFLYDKIGKDKVNFIVDKERYAKYGKQDRYINGKKYDFNVISSDDTSSTPPDLLIFAVKSTTLREAIEVSKKHVSKDTTIISLLNGITSEDTIAQFYDPNQILYSVAEGMDPIKSGYNLSYTNMGYLRLGSDRFDSGKKDRLDSLINFFDQISFPYVYEENILRRMWSKFMLNVGVNQVVMIYEGNYHTIQKPGEARELMISAMREVISLADKESICLTEEDLDFYVALVDTLNPLGIPSMRHDGLYKIKSEVEMFSGKVLELSNKHNLSTPINSMIYNRIKRMESEY